VVASDCRLIVGEASAFAGAADFVFTHPYAPLPPQLCGLPAVLNLYAPPEVAEAREEQLMEWIDAPVIAPLGRWGRGGNNAVYVANLPPRAVELADLVEDEFEPGRGWFPLALPERLLDLYADHLPAGSVVWDGFCGRATVGKAALARGLRYIGIDRDAARIALARTYLRSDART
jgi:hypothetical protein